MALTYSQYLHLDELLQQQKPLSKGAEHDEMLFIIIHQVYELWFKQTLHETSQLTQSFSKNDPTTALSALKRILTILKTMVSQVDILETMTPLSFASFRNLLESSSGFQSVQFRELEIALGKRDLEKIKRMPVESRQIEKLIQAHYALSVYDAFLHFLKIQGFAIPLDALHHDVTTTRKTHAGVQKILIEIYKTRPDLAQICERLVDWDEGLQEWRYRHVKMVERTIGIETGTGGSSGLDYLKTTLFSPMFCDLWEIRKEF